MKHILIIFMLAICPIISFSQDIITLKTGDEIKSKVLKIGSTEVEYKKWTNQNGPIYTCPKTDIFMIKYQNGEKDLFQSNLSKPSSEKQINQNNQNTTVDREIEPKVSSYNLDVVNTYNIPFEYIGKISDKTAKYGMSILGVGQNSVLSTDEVVISLKNCVPQCTKCAYCIEVSNKTNEIIYVDLANCFCNGNTFYTGESTTTSNGTVLGASVTAGIVPGIGISVGAGKTRGISHTSVQNRILSIAPLSSVILRTHKELYKSKDMLGPYEHASCGEYMYQYDKLFMKLKVGEIINYSVNNSPQKQNYLITYSKTQDYSQYSSISFNTYVRAIVGLAKWPLWEKDAIKPIRIGKIINNCNDKKWNK